MAVSYSFIKNDNTAGASTELTYAWRENKGKRERRMVLPSPGVVAKTACRGIRCSSVLKTSACKFSEERLDEQIVVTLCKCIYLETLIFA